MKQVYFLLLNFKERTQCLNAKMKVQLNFLEDEKDSDFITGSCCRNLCLQ